MQLHTVHLDAPFVCCIVEHGAKLCVDGVARCERLVQLHLADDVSQRCLCELLNGVRQVVDLVNSLEWVHNLEIEQGVDLHLNVVFRDHVLLVEVVNMFAQVYRVRVGIASACHRYDGLCAVYERYDDVNARFQGVIIFSQTLNDLCLALRNNHHGHFYKDNGQHYYCR